jgi:hypothetical protein
LGFAGVPIAENEEKIKLDAVPPADVVPLDVVTSENVYVNS